MTLDSRELWLLVRAGGQLCALPLEHVEETMRPQPVRTISGAPPFVRGTAVVRGAPVPVVDAAAALGAASSSAGLARFVALRTNASRRVALAVHEVVGVRRIRQSDLAALPPLFARAPQQIVSSLGTLDRELLVVLQAGKLVPETVWSSMTAGPNR